MEKEGRGQDTQVAPVLTEGLLDRYASDSNEELDVPRYEVRLQSRIRQRRMEERLRAWRVARESWAPHSRTSVEEYFLKDKIDDEKKRYESLGDMAKSLENIESPWSDRDIESPVIRKEFVDSP